MTKKEFLRKVTARLKYNPIWSELLYQTGSNIKDKKWIFICGCYNSGTTLLDQILASHPQISGLPDEGVMLTDQLVRPEDFGWRRMWSECEDDMKNSTRSLKMNSNRIKKHWSHFFELKREYLLEKSISNMTRLEFFENSFTPAYFIHIVRNGYAVAEGIHRKAEVMPENSNYESRKYPLSLCAKQWVRSLEVFEKQKNSLKNVIEITYEDLAENPADTVNEILAKIGLERFKDGQFNKSFEVHEKKSTIRNMNDSSFNRLNRIEIEEINKVAVDSLIKYGYKIL